MHWKYKQQLYTVLYCKFKDGDETSIIKCSHKQILTHYVRKRSQKWENSFIITLIMPVLCVFSRVGRFGVLSICRLFVVPLGAKWREKNKKIIFVQNPMRATLLKVIFSKNSRGKKDVFFYKLTLQYIFYTWVGFHRWKKCGVSTGF